MSITIKTPANILALIMLTSALSCVCGQATDAQSAVKTHFIAPSQLAALVPNEQDLLGFVSILPDSSLSDRPPMETPGDFVLLNYDLTQMPSGLPNTGSMSRLFRRMYSSDGAYMLEMDVRIYDTSEAAQQAVQDRLSVSQGIFKHGKYRDSFDIGDESYVTPLSSTDNHLIFRAGKTRIELHGSLSYEARGNQDIPDFSPSALEAVAYQILLRASQQTALTGVSAQSARLAVNGHALPKNALKVAGRVYVPVKEFAQAMGLTSHWNSKSGALTLSGPKQKTVALTAGSTAASVGGAKTSALTVPVLKDGGQPVMALDDLLKLTGGCVTKQTETAMQAKS